MWFERFVIIVTSLHRDYLPSSWVYYSPTWVEIGIYTGTIGLFLTLFLLFARAFPVVAIAEVKAIFKTSSEVAKKKMHANDQNGGGGHLAGVPHNKE
jgi:molybdopterin-containing oxidoreductase family membrane subunit